MQSLSLRFVGADGRPYTFRPLKKTLKDLLPEDRDQAFAKYDGLLLDLVRPMAPQLTEFGPKFNSILGMTWNGRTVDRDLLVGLSRSDWDSVVSTVQSRLDDSVIDEALRRLPKSHYDLVAEDTAVILRIRRDKLPEIAEAYYCHLAGEVDIQATETSEVIKAKCLDEGFLTELVYNTLDSHAWPRKGTYLMIKSDYFPEL
jgi:hypothetical protein